MAKTFLGVGAGFPLRLKPDGGGLVLAAYEESVRLAILIILGTAKGDRVMRPDFGCGIHDLVFESLSAATLGRVQQMVHQALLRLEPRIDVIDVAARPAGDGNTLLIHVEYEVRATNNAFNLVYPFYLQQGVAG